MYNISTNHDINIDIFSRVIILKFHLSAQTALFKYDQNYKKLASHQWTQNIQVVN